MTELRLVGGRCLVDGALGHDLTTDLRDAVEGPVSAACPASIIQLHHAYANKPGWQGL